MISGRFLVVALFSAALLGACTPKDAPATKPPTLDQNQARDTFSLRVPRSDVMGKVRYERLDGSLECTGKGVVIALKADASMDLKLTLLSPDGHWVKGWSDVPVSLVDGRWSGTAPVCTDHNVRGYLVQITPDR